MGKTRAFALGKKGTFEVRDFKTRFSKACTLYQFVSASKYEMHRIARIIEILSAYFAPAKTIY